MQPDDDEDDDLRWEEWLELTDAQQEAACERAEREYFGWLEALAPADRYRVNRGQALRALASARRLLADPFMGKLECIREMQEARIADNRLWLAKLRIYRKTGVFPGSG